MSVTTVNVQFRPLHLWHCLRKTIFEERKKKRNIPRIKANCLDLYHVLRVENWIHATLRTGLKCFCLYPWKYIGCCWLFKLCPHFLFPKITKNQLMCQWKMCWWTVRVFMCLLLCTCCLRKTLKMFQGLSLWGQTPFSLLSSDNTSI